MDSAKDIEGGGGAGVSDSYLVINGWIKILQIFRYFVGIQGEDINSARGAKNSVKSMENLEEEKRPCAFL